MEVQRIPKRTVSVIEPQKSILVDKEKYHQKRVAAYCRVSTDSEEQLTSYQNQTRVYTEMIAANKEWEFAGLYADEGISGTRADKRPEFQRMIRDCQNGKIDYIITKSVSRFARNTVECLEYVRSLKAQGIGIFFEEQNIDTLKNESELYLVIYAGFAQSESESISKHITWTYRKKFEEGKVSFQYKNFLGYRKGTDNQPEIVPEEAAIVERIYEMFLAGQPVKVIAQTLQAEKIEIPGKNLSFSKNMIMNILRNEKYCGDCILQKTVTVDCISKTRKVNQGEAPMYIVENNHPAIISREVFNRVQEELIRRQALRAKSDKTSITATGKYSKYALTEVLQCAECGSRYRRVTWTAHGRKKIVWRCISRLDYGTKHCKDSITVEEEALHGAVVRALNRFRAEDESTYLTLMKATIGEAIGINGGSEEIDLLTRRIDTLNKRMLDLVNETVAAGKDVESNEDEFKGISDQIEQLNRRIAAIQESIHKNGSRQARLEEIQSIIAERNANETQYDDSIVRQMIECIKVHNDGKLTIIFGGGYEIEETL
nr:MAG TPA: integrase [Caudoviricetes sp.]